MNEKVAGLAVTVPLSDDDLALLVDSLDAYEYWQLGDVLPRNNGAVWIPGDGIDANDRYWRDTEPTPEQAEAIEAVRACRELADRLLDRLLSSRATGPPNR